MIWMLLKWVIGLGVLAVIAMALLSQKTFHTEVIIEAPPAVVWSVLTDTARYAEWNPTFIRVEGVYREGTTVKTLVQEPTKTTEIAATVAKLVPERQLNQTGGMLGLLTFDHQWLLEPTAGGTKATQHEVDRGLWLWFWDSSWVQPAYEKASLALRDRVLDVARMESEN